MAVSVRHNYLRVVTHPYVKVSCVKIWQKDKKTPLPLFQKKQKNRQVRAGLQLHSYIVMYSAGRYARVTMEISYPRIYNIIQYYSRVYQGVYEGVQG